MKSTKERPRNLSLNTRFMISDPVRALVRAGKADALATFLVLQTIARKFGYCVYVDDILISKITFMTGYDAARIRADIRAIVAAGFFDANLYASRQVLSSRRLQLAYRRRKDAQPIPDHLLLCGSKAADSKKKEQTPEAERPRLSRAERRRIERAERRKASGRPEHAYPHPREYPAK